MNNETTAAAIREAIGAHGAWKLKFRKAARTGELPAPVQTIAADDQCAFGQLLQSLAPALGDDADYETIRAMHADFHINAGKLAQHIVAGDTARVSFELSDGGVFEKRSLALSARLADWRIKLKYRPGITGGITGMTAGETAGETPLTRCCAQS